MYTCVRAIVRQRGDSMRLMEAQVGDIAVRTLATEYAYVFLVLTHPAVTGEMGLDLTTVEDLVYALGPDITVDQWLSSLGSTSLPTVGEIPEKTTRVVRYNDAYNGKYHIERIHPLSGDGNQMSDYNLTDLRLTRTDTDYQQFFEHVLVTSGGLLHLTDYSTAGVVVKDAGRSQYHSGRLEVGLISFLEVGKVTCYPITDEMILPRGEQPLESGFNIHLPGVDLSNKTVLLSLGGILHTLNHLYKVVGTDKVLIEWWKLNFVELYYLLKPLIDLSSFDETMNIPENHGEALDLDEAFTDESIKAFMKLSQTFLIVVEAENFYVERHALEATGLAGRYYCYQLPRFPLQLETGLLAEYVATREVATYVLAVNENFSTRLVHGTRPESDTRYYHGGKISQFPQYYASAYLLEMGSETLETT